MENLDTKDYTGAGFEYVVDKKFRPVLCFGTKTPREVLPRKGPCMVGFMRRHGAEDTYRKKLCISVPPPLRSMKLLTMSKCPRWMVKKMYQPPPRTMSPPPPRKMTPHAPFNSNCKQRPKWRDNRIPGPGTYNPSNKKREMKFNHSFGGDKIIVPAVDIKCVPYNHDLCLICGTNCGEQGDYWHQDNRVFLCRRCCERQHVTHSRFSKLQLEEFKPIRDCFFAHHHELYQNSIKLIGTAQIKKKIYREAYLAQYFSNIKEEKYICSVDT